ncbi:uncharacterized protein LOC106661695 [Cimex lectularius]|uniref:Uncharacterized protein n=1 Tax=Cimex lectularius TaxID=79782 RepID=A0A8I6R7R0_CIMLE|nr:uncharacterized protein LOC106661695 [Cimex lectularius]
MFLIRNVRTGINLLSRQLKRNVTLSKMRMSTVDEPNDQPVKFSTSKASKWKAEFSRRGTSKEESPWFEPLAVGASAAVFLIYFCVLREENDIDEKLDISIYRRIDGLEEYQLRQLLAHNKRNGKDVTDIENRLQELSREKMRS